MVEHLSFEVRENISKIYSHKAEYKFIKNKNKSTLQNAAYRIFDLIGAILILIFSTPFIILAILLIALQDGRPFLFKQIRLGLNGKPFIIYKFRSMRNDAEDILREDSELYQLYLENDYKLPPEKDPRVTKIGSFLRKSSIDEIPQLINVLKGEMSLVGPRPIVPKELERYEEFSDLFLSVKPGITGLWQVSGRSDIGYPERKFLDVIYITEKSILNDIRILLRTVKTVFLKIGAH